MQSFPVLLALAGRVIGHSWVEQLVRIAANGTLVSPTGYMRGYVGRADPGFVDAFNMHLVPPHGRPEGNVLRSDDRICGNAQTIGNYSADYPMLSAAPGDLVALRYQENGHVTLPENGPPKPSNRGTIYIYGTSDPSDDDAFLDIHRVWTTDEPNNERKGRLIATRNFDDGQCYQLNDGAISVERQASVDKEAQDPQGADLWCQASVWLPSDLPTSGTYTLYWVWDWPTIDGDPAGDGDGPEDISPEIYTSCLDINLIEDGISNTENTSFVHSQDPNSRAIREQMEDDFLVA